MSRPGHGDHEYDPTCDGCLMLTWVTRAERAEAERDRLRKERDDIDEALRTTAQAHADLECENENLRAAITALADDLNRQAAAAELPVDFARNRIAERLRAILDGDRGGTPNV